MISIEVTSEVRTRMDLSLVARIALVMDYQTDRWTVWTRSAPIQLSISMRKWGPPKR